ncbi:hypothetical protein ACWE42_12090 [Sutcliffiella cohnii]
MTSNIIEKSKGINIVLLIIFISIFNIGTVNAEVETSEVEDRYNSQIKNALNEEKLNRLEGILNSMDEVLSGKLDKDTYKELYDNTINQMSNILESTKSDLDFIKWLFGIFGTLVVTIGGIIAFYDYSNSKKVNQKLEAVEEVKEKVNKAQAEVNELHEQIKYKSQSVEEQSRMIEEKNKIIDEKAIKIDEFYEVFDDLNRQSVEIIEVITKIKGAFDNFAKNGNTESLKANIDEAIGVANSQINVTSPTKEMINHGKEVEKSVTEEKIEYDEL